jgi:hypothetical protein
MNQSPGNPKPHKGTIYSARIIKVLGGRVAIGLYVRESRVVVRRTSYIVRQDGNEIETLNSKYTLSMAP